MSESKPLAPALQPGRMARTGRAARQTGWAGWLPGIDSIRHYEIAWLRHDVLAGLVLTAVLVPVGIAYAVASGVPAICGLYATIFGLLAYALFGPSRVLVLGPDSSLVALTLGVVLPLSAGDVKDKLKRFGLFSRLGEERFFATMGQAVSSYLKAHSVQWVDWEDRR